MKPRIKTRFCSFCVPRLTTTTPVCHVVKGMYGMYVYHSGEAQPCSETTVWKTFPNLVESMPSSVQYWTTTVDGDMRQTGLLLAYVGGILNGLSQSDTTDAQVGCGRTQKGPHTQRRKFQHNSGKRTFGSVSCDLVGDGKWLTSFNEVTTYPSSTLKQTSPLLNADLCEYSTNDPV